MIPTLSFINYCSSFSMVGSSYLRNQLIFVTTHVSDVVKPGTQEPRVYLSFIVVRFVFNKSPVQTIRTPSSFRSPVTYSFPRTTIEDVPESRTVKFLRLPIFPRYTSVLLRPLKIVDTSSCCTEKYVKYRVQFKGGDPHYCNITPF